MGKVFIGSFLALVIFSSCWNIFGKKVRGNGTVITSNLDMSNMSYRSIDVSGSMDVYVKQDSVSSVKIETDENLIRYIVVRTEGDELKIYPKDNYNLRPSGAIKVFVSGPVFKDFEASGACDFYSENKISDPEKISLDLSGACNATMDLNAPEVSVDISGSGSAILKGETKNLEADGSGSSRFKCFDLKAENVEVDISGSGEAEVFASVKLDVEISGSGSVTYKGNAAVNQKISGSGSVKKVE